MWKYLQEANKNDILGLPDVPSNVSLDNYDLTEAEKYLIGFCLCRGKSRPRKTGFGQNSWNKDKIRIANNLYKIKHWFIAQEPYWKLPNIKATWFIDPPYQMVQKRPGNTDRYQHWEIDYVALAEFIQSRHGQVIACEGEGADYLPFELLATVNTNTNNHTVKKNSEYIYIQNND